MSDRWKGAVDALIFFAVGAALAFGADIALWRGVVLAAGLAVLAVGVVRLVLCNVVQRIQIRITHVVPDDDDPDEDEVDPEMLPPVPPLPVERSIWN